MTGDDFDDAYMAAARKAAQLRTSGEYSSGRSQAQRAVPARATTMGRDFDLSMIRPGWVLHSAATEDELMDGAGAVCVEVLDAFTDRETGEMVGTRYRCVRHWNPQRRTLILPANWVDTDKLYGLDRQLASASARWLIQPLILSRSMSRRRDTLTDDQIERLHDAWRLAAAVAL